VPQFALSVCRFTQVRPHAVWPAGQAQAPEVHVAPVAHAVPQAPQLRVSVATVTHTPAQTI
jgi:hypothetical protein